MSSTTELIVLPPPESVRTVFTTPKGLDPYLQQIKTRLDAFEPDVSTKKGRDAIASIAHQVAKGKVAVDNIGKDLVADMKKEPALVDAERKRWRDQMDAWKDEVRAPLTAWEEAEEARIHAHKDRILMMQEFAQEAGTYDAAYLQARIDQLSAMPVDESWQEFEAEAHRTKTATLATLADALRARQKHDAEQAELAELRAKAAAQEQKDREERIAREAAEQARREADAQAQAERDAAAKREADAKAAAEHAELQLRLQVEHAEREKAEAQRREQQAQQDAERRAAEAVAAEKRRVAAQAEAEAREARRREADRAHKGAVNRAAVAAFIQGGMTEECAKQAVTLIAKKAIPAVSITY